MSGPGGVDEALATAWAEIAGPDGGSSLDAVRITGPVDPVLPSVFRLGALAASSVATATLAAALFGAERMAGPGAAATRPHLSLGSHLSVAGRRNRR